MKILVSCKCLLSAYLPVRPTNDGLGVTSDNPSYVINPFDSVALTQAVQLKKHIQHPVEIIVVSIGPSNLVEGCLSKTMAMGGDRGIAIVTDENLCSLDIAKVIAHIATLEKVALLIMGKQSADGEHHHVGPMVAGLLDWPQACAITKFQYLNQEMLAVATQVDTGLDYFTVPMPAVITTDLMLNKPKYPSPIEIVQGKKKPINSIDLTGLMPNLYQGYKAEYTSHNSESPSLVITDSAGLLKELGLKAIITESS